MNKLAMILIVVQDRLSQAPQLNQVLGEYGDLILSRMGNNVGKTLPNYNVSGCISCLLEGDEERINELHEKLNKLEGIKTTLTYVA